MSTDWKEYRKNEAEMWRKVGEILKQEGWKPMDRDMDGQYLTIFTHHGNIIRRWVEYETEYAEWGGREFVYYNLWTKDVFNIKFKRYDDCYAFLDDSNIACFAHPKRITRSKGISAAVKLMEDFYGE